MPRTLGLARQIEGKVEYRAYESKKWTEDDSDAQTTHCGICGSDLHPLKSEWGPATYLTSAMHGRLLNPPS